MNSALTEARTIRDHAIASPNCSEDHRTHVQMNVEKLEQLAIELINDEAMAVKTSLSTIG